ncbi:class I SAM-dependent methyltransferase [Lentzea tibetensis]|uniref:Class I SAM-dependent methyltransferase n=1 Tax=Lentzea tibetensis TaxID=2591470 RepID=A0A563ER49_9PSEU|nr:class I SAM-dependent methyltransferase [Lentzea tibetensis]TWP50156.1 class I SAM-dependent methyltransferase [Lentzea tibetensis]
MTQPKITPLHEDTTFHGPLSEERAARLIGSLGPFDGAHVVDLGCGWAEMLLRIVAADPTATGLGVDRDEEAIEHGRANARERGLADRVELVVGDVGEWDETQADVLIVNGSSQVWGGDPLVHTENALRNAHRILRPGGRLLLGECFWEREPTDAQLAAMPVPKEQYRSLAGLVDFAIGHGFRLLWLEQASLDEWDEFESRHGLAWEHWLLANPDSPHADEIRAKADRQRNFRLHGWRATMGLAYLTLVRP